PLSFPLSLHDALPISVKSDPAPEGSNTSKYSFLFPLRPGETRFNVVYTMPYTGSVNIDPKSVYPLEHFVAIAPKAMQFAPATDGDRKSTRLNSSHDQI